MSRFNQILLVFALFFASPYANQNCLHAQSGGLSEIRTKLYPSAIASRKWISGGSGEFEGAFLWLNEEGIGLFFTSSGTLKTVDQDKLTADDRIYIKSVMARIRPNPKKTFTDSAGAQFRARYLQTYHTEFWFSETETNRFRKIPIANLDSFDAKVIAEFLQAQTPNAVITGQTFRFWTVNGSHKILGRLKAIGENKILLRQDSGEVAVDLSALSSSDVNYVNRYRTSDEPTPAPQEEAEEKSEIDKLFNKFGAQTFILVFGIALLLLFALICIKYVSGSFRGDAEDNIY